MKSPIKWVGGKYKLLPTILPLIPSHKGYVEVFGGAGWLLFAKEPSQFEVLNDLDENLCNFWDVIKNNPEEFIESFNYELVSRKTFNDYKQLYISKKYDNKIQQAHVLYCLLKAGTGSSLPDGGGCGFGISKDTSRLVLDKIPNDINSAYNRLKKVTIECRDFRKVINSFDDKTTFFYLDPPYRNTARHAYPVGPFTDKDYNDLATLCHNMKGKFLLSINDDPYIKTLFYNFHIHPLSVSYNMSTSTNGRKKYGELLISNYSQDSTYE